VHAARSVALTKPPEKCDYAKRLHRPDRRCGICVKSEVVYDAVGKPSGLKRDASRPATDMLKHPATPEKVPDDGTGSR
jgi:hypothetical protein